MPESKHILKTLDKLLRRENISPEELSEYLSKNYRDIGTKQVRNILNGVTKLKVSDLEAICTRLNITIYELFHEADKDKMYTYQLTLDQEYELVKNPSLMLITFLLLNNWTMDNIVEKYNISRKTLTKSREVLIDLKLIKVDSTNRVTCVASPDFRWHKRGPVNKLLWGKIVPEYLKNEFKNDDDYFKFIPFMISEHTHALLKNEMENLVQRIYRLAVEDAQSHTIEERLGFSALIATRRYVYSEISPEREFDF